MIARYAKIFLMVLSAPALGESLCELKSPSKSEAIICANPGLRALDRKLNEVYSAAYRINNSQPLKMDQLHWLKNQRDKCDSDACLSEVYENRIFFLGQTIEAHKMLNDQPLAKSEYFEVCNGIAALASDNKLHDYKVVGVDFFSIINSVKKNWGSTEGIEKYCAEKGFCDIQEIYNIKISNVARAKKFIKHVSPESCPSNIIYPIDRFTRIDGIYSGRLSVSDPDDTLGSAAWGSDEFPIYYQQRNYIITGTVTEPKVVSLIQSDGQILPLCLLTKSSAGLAVTEGKDKDLCAGVASGLIKPQQWSNQYTPTKAEEAELINMSEARGQYDIRLFLPSISENENKPSHSFVKFMQDSGAGCGSHNEWLRRAVLEGGTFDIRFDDQLFSGKTAEHVDVYLHNEKHYIGYFPSYGPSALYHLENDVLAKICEFEKKLEFKINRIF